MVVLSKYPTSLINCKKLTHSHLQQIVCGSICDSLLSQQKKESLIYILHSDRTCFSSSILLILNIKLLGLFMTYKLLKKTLSSLNPEVASTCVLKTTLAPEG